MNLFKHRRNIIFVGGLVAMAVVFSRCSSSSSSSGSSLSTASKITTGLGSATSAIQGMGGTLAATSSFAVGGNHITSAATSCDVHGDPGLDGLHGGTVDGVIDSSERYYQSEANYALQKFYCTLAAESTGPETVAGAVRTIKMVACAVEQNLGSINFNNTPVAFTSITIDTHCATAQQITDMGGSGGTLTMTLNGTITAAKDPSGSNWPEVSGNTYYSHGIRIASDDGTSLKFVLLAKFDDTVAGDPVENGDFEFATMGTGTMMQGSAIEYTSGKIDRISSTSGSLWYESRINRVKSSGSDPICNGTTSSCGFTRHTRVKGDLTFTGGDISDVANLTGFITEGYDTTGSGQTSNYSFAVTATGSLASEITGKIYDRNASAATFGGTDTLNGNFTAGTTTCIQSGGAILSSGCATPLAVGAATTISAFFLPSNSPTSTWIDYLSTHGGIGYSGSTTAADTQTAL